MFRDYLASAAHQYGLYLSDEQLAAFNRYYELLLDWNSKLNLTAITEPKEVAVKHIIDSLSCYDEDYFPPACRVIDVGSGAGFPGLPLKIYRPDISVVLLDSLNKRLTFLQAVIQELDLSGVTTLHARAEEGGRRANLRDSFHVVTSRAVARLSVLAELCLPFVKPGGVFVALKGAQFAEEAAEAQTAVRLLGGRLAHVRQVHLPGLDDKRAVIYIAKDKLTPAAYPRKPGTPDKHPL